MSASVLLVDDEPQILRALTPALEAAGYAVSVADCGQAALSRLASDGFDAILLDLGLPDMDGKDVIARVREWSEAPILVLSARDIENEKIEALDLGADDYVSKPFAMGELLARLRASLRGRERRFSTRSHFSAGPLFIDFSQRLVRLEGEEVKLTPKEYDLLRTLARHSGRVVTHRQLIAAVWGGDADAQSVRVLAAQVRQKLEVDASRPKLIVTEQGVGYRLVGED
ncbi:response regulator transcription factor [Caulobacter sp. 17J65-9]|uniref:response regulator transcription factor n=1 Tax=Caulobacter sp. 17J65-9 TaxID=2709382 RepID=UPI0013C5C8EF|nr:response regulator transcription factor [Caulobacter sp. 17J65-9]NEX93650.1 response regulator transcription factor [Caulobacter sp. 17J65-9]